jgi:endoglucanase
VVANRATIGAKLHPWAAAAKAGVSIHFGELGCYKYTPSAVVYAWFNDTLDVIGALNSGWALWNFRGPYGILDTGRSDTLFTDWHGHQLDSTLLEFLQSKIRS